MIKSIRIIIALMMIAGGVHAQQKSSSKPVQISHTKDFAISDLDSPQWKRAKPVAISNYWSGQTAPDKRHFTARMLWSDSTLYVRFDARVGEPLIVSDKPDTSKKTIGLWDRDVCEIFIAPDSSRSNKYFEFEIAPTGEWIDLGIQVTPEKRITDWEYKSGMASAVKVTKDKLVMAIAIPFASLGRTPARGDKWLGNLFRCVGTGPTRGYLSWQPTMTAVPSFHVPDKFGEFEFVK